jgi:ADP-ribose pyrophosphatase YjhB (NUDIX family)
LTNKNGQTYSRLTSGYDFENNIVFHLKQLIKDNLIEKVDDIYKITAKGMREIYSLGLPDLDYPDKKLFYCGFVVTDGNDNFLMKGHSNAKVNFHNLPSGDPRFGEKIEESLVRIFENNTGIKIKSDRFAFICLHMKTTKTSNQDILFDDGQAIYKVEVTRGEKEKMKLMSDVKWYSKNEIEKIPNCWTEIKMCILDNNILPYASYEVVSDYKL